MTSLVFIKPNKTMNIPTMNSPKSLDKPDESTILYEPTEISQPNYEFHTYQRRECIIHEWVIRDINLKACKSGGLPLESKVFPEKSQYECSISIKSDRLNESSGGFNDQAYVSFYDRPNSIEDLTKELKFEFVSHAQKLDRELNISLNLKIISTNKPLERKLINFKLTNDEKKYEFLRLNLKQLLDDHINTNVLVMQFECVSNHGEAGIDGSDELRVKTVNFHWEIPECFDLFKKLHKHNSIQSPRFYFDKDSVVSDLHGNHQWLLQLYPQGSKEKMDTCSVYLKHLTTNSIRAYVDFEIFSGASDSKKNNACFGYSLCEYLFQSQNRWGIGDCLNGNRLKDRPDLLKEMKIVCRITTYRQETINANSLINGFNRLERYMVRLRASGSLLDTILMSSLKSAKQSEKNLNGIHCHRILLASLSDKMEKLIIRESSESKSAHLTICFKYSTECLTELVYFIYKHKLSNLVDVITCCELFRFSIRYDIYELESLCEKWLIENMCYEAIKLIHGAGLAEKRAKLKQHAFNWLTIHFNNLSQNADICKILIYFAKH